MDSFREGRRAQGGSVLRMVLARRLRLIAAGIGLGLCRYYLRDALHFSSRVAAIITILCAWE